MTNKDFERIVKIAPFSGLLGTVAGMIYSFSMIIDSTEPPDVAVLAGGICRAVLATSIATGVGVVIIVAIGFAKK